MTLARLVLASLHHHRREHAAVVACAALAVTVLSGSLLVGDSVAAGLRDLARTRLGSVSLALLPPGRTVRAALADSLAAALGTTVVPALALDATAALPDGTRPTFGVRLMGVDDRFFAFGAGAARMTGPGSFDWIAALGSDSVILGDALARSLGVGVGSELILRAEKPGAIPRDLPLSVDERATVALRVTVRAVLDAEHLGRFALFATGEAPLDAFVSLRWLAERASAPDRANLLLVAAGPTAEKANAALRAHLTLADADLELREVAASREVELSTSRIFVEPAVTRAVGMVAPDARGVLTWFVKDLAHGDRHTPYSTVAALSPAALAAAGIDAALGDGDIVINEWLAADLHAHPGDEVELRYDVFGSGRALEERTTRLRVHHVVPLAGPWADPTLMPEIPGLSDARSCRDWQPGIPIDSTGIRDEDEAYWRDHRGTPKAFVSLAIGARLWSSRYGDRTAIRFPARPAAEKLALESQLARALDPTQLGLAFRDVAAEARAGAAPTVDAGPLFIGFGLFLMVSALLLTALLFALGVDRRASEAGLLLCLGYTPSRVRRLLLAEAAVLAMAGGVLGAGGAVLYTGAVLAALSTVWRDAMALPSLPLVVPPATLLMGSALATAASLGVMWLVLGARLRLPPRALLAGAGEEMPPTTAATPTRTSRTAFGPRAIAVTAAAAAALLVALSSGRSGAGAMYFFGAGALLLIAGIAAADALFAAALRPGDRATMRLRLLGLGLLDLSRRRRRSLATVALLACGSFLVVAVGANRQDPRAGSDLRSAGTGGFALYAELSRPLVYDLETPAGLDVAGLDAADLPGTTFVPLRLKGGDEASCRNPGRPGSPRILGVRPDALAQRSAFTFEAWQPAPGDTASPWHLLDRPLEGGAVPAIGDEGTVVWSLHRKLGDTLDEVDGEGRPLKLRIVAITASSILQGGLVIAEDRFLAHFPGESGYRVLLVDAPPDRADAVGTALQSALFDLGPRIVPAFRRLALFHAVENTYLAIFQALGALGLLLGCAGVGVLVMRQVLEDRGELALLSAVGFPRARIFRLVLVEHALLVALGLGAGVGAALIAIAPALAAPGAPVPLASLACSIALIAAGALASATIAAALALRGPITSALGAD